MAKKSGFTLNELMIGLIITTLLITALWDVFSASRRNANEIVANHAINNELEMMLMRISDDLRESNAINASYPTIIEPAKAAEINQPNANVQDLMSKEENKIVFTKINYDFQTDPSTLSSNEVNYTKEEITYYPEEEEKLNENADTTYSLLRQSKVFDKEGKEVDSEGTVYPYVRGLKSCVFYQIKDENSARSGNVYLRFELARQDSAFNSKYTNTITITVKERAACPE